MARQKTGPPKKPQHWHRMDLHIHTPASDDYKDAGVTYVQILQQAEAKGLDILAFTDHNTVAGYSAMWDEVEDLLMLEKSGRLSPAEKVTLAEYRRLSEKIMVLPGFELTATFGFHIIGVFPPGSTVRKLEHVLLNLNVPDEKLELGSTEVGATADVMTIYKEIAEAGGLAIAAHANSSHGVAMQGQGWDFVGGQTRIAYTQDKNLHALEVTDLESTSRRSTRNFFNGSKPEYPRRMHCIQGSDAHRLAKDPHDKSNPWGVGDRATEVLLDEVSFAELLQLFKGDDFDRTRPARPAAAAPFDHVKSARQQGPSIVQSFHEAFSAKPNRFNLIIADVVAFANTNGGTVFVGLSANPKTPAKGVEHAEEACESLRAELLTAITPPIDVEISSPTTEGRKVLELRVPKGRELPYVLNNGQIFVRQESETTVAMRDEIIRLVEQGRPAAEPAPVAVAAPAVAVSVAAAHPAQPAPQVEPQPQAPAATEAGEPAAAAPTITLPFPAPRTGVEVIDSEQRDSVWHHTVQDLRNANIVRNVTRFSARHLWRYAITEREQHPVEEGEVAWHGDLGLWKTYKRAGVKRYNLVQRDSLGGLHIYYGVTEDGMTEPWSQFIEDKTSKEPGGNGEEAAGNGHETAAGESVEAPEIAEVLEVPEAAEPAEAGEHAEATEAPEAIVTAGDREIDEEEETSWEGHEGLTEAIMSDIG